MRLVARYAPKDYSNVYQIGDDLAKAATKFDEPLVKEITDRINWLHLNQMDLMLPAYDAAIEAVDRTRTHDIDAMNQRTRMRSILENARAQFVEKEKYHQFWY